MRNKTNGDRELNGKENKQTNKQEETKKIQGESSKKSKQNQQLRRKYKLK